MNSYFLNGCVIMINKIHTDHLSSDLDPHGLGPSLASFKFHPNSRIKTYSRETSLYVWLLSHALPQMPHCYIAPASSPLCHLSKSLQYQPPATNIPFGQEILPPSWTILPQASPAPIGVPCPVQSHAELCEGTPERAGKASDLMQDHVLTYPIS